MTQNIKYPYMPANRGVEYVPEDNIYMIMAKKFAKDNSLDKVMPTASVILRDGVVIGIGANGSDYHEKHECERVRQDIPTGQGYEMCPGCHPKNHSELTAIKNAYDEGNEAAGADLYLWGHWWCCEPCWDAIVDAGIERVYLMEESEKLFNKEYHENIVGRQFEV